jgi:hypothetical protein
MESRLLNSPQAVAMESKPRYRDSLGPPCARPPRGSQGVVLLSPKVWNGHHGGENLAIGIACFTNPPPLTRDQTHTHRTQQHCQSLQPSHPILPAAILGTLLLGILPLGRRVQISPFKPLSCHLAPQLVILDELSHETNGQREAQSLVHFCLMRVPKLIFLSIR